MCRSIRSFALVLGAALAAGALARTPDIPRLGRVSLIKVEGEIDQGTAAFIHRVLGDHRKEELVVLELNTLGGHLAPAIEIRDALLAAEATTLCWVHPRAISAGALITLSCDVVVVSPGATIGAATPLIVGAGDPRIDEKVLSYMRQEMATTAASTGRRQDVARAMVDGEVVVEGLNKKGELVTLDADGALRWEVADLQAASLDDAWSALGRDPPSIERIFPSPAESLARFVSDPVVSMLLMEGSAGRWNKLDPTLKALAVMVSSAQIGCSWCVDFGYWEFHHQGVDPKKLRDVPRWRDSDAYTDLERAVMEYTEAMTATPPQVTDEHVERLRQDLTDEQVVELTAWVSLENYRSRTNAALGLTSQGFKELCELRPA